MHGILDAWQYGEGIITENDEGNLYSCNEYVEELFSFSVSQL